MGSFFKKKVRADLAGWNLVASLIDPEDCWRAVCMLRGYSTSGPIATCEMAFVRAAIVKNAIKRSQRPEIAALMLAATDRLIKERFADQDTDESLTHYENQPLSKVGPEIIRQYEENALTMMILASFFASRLDVPGVPIDIAPLFEEIDAAAERAMKSVEIVP